MIHFQHISKQYENHKALDEISFSIQQAKIFGLLGPNGAGKTTLLRILTRMLLPDVGNVVYEGHEITEEDVFKIGYLPEERGLYPKMRADDHIYFLAALKKVPKSKCKDQLVKWSEKLEIEHLLSRRIENLSKGQQQKIQLIASLVHDPDLLILDEPFSGFDPVNAELLKNILLDLRKEGKTILISTHRMDNAEVLCDEIAMLNKGKLVLNGSMKYVLDPHGSRRFRVAVAGTLRSNELYDILAEEDGVYHLSTKESVTTNQLLIRLTSEAEVLSFEPEKKTLREVFLERAEA